MDPNVTIGDSNLSSITIGGSWTFTGTFLVRKTPTQHSIQGDISPAYVACFNHRKGAKSEAPKSLILVMDVVLQACSWNTSDTPWVL